MTVNDLLNKARKAANDKVWPYYLEICDGNVEEAKDWIEHERKAGVIDKDVEHWTMENIFKLIRTIKTTTLMSDAEKEAAIEEIKKCPEYRQMEKRVAMLFANHFVQYKDAYLK